MPNRILKESICVSETINRLDWFTEVFFYRLITQCDDFGRFDARPAIIKARLFPLRDIRHEQIASALQKLALEELAILYHVDGKPFVQLSSWAEHQRVRNSVKKYPEPSESDPPQVAASCGELPQLAADCGLNPESRIQNPNPESQSRRARARPSKVSFAEYVALTQQEYDTLTEEFGEPATLKAIEILNNYKGANGRQYKSDYMAMRNWTFDRVKKDHPALFRARTAPADPSVNPFDDMLGGWQ